MPEIERKLLVDLIGVLHPKEIEPDKHAEGWYIYHLEIGEVGFSLSMRWTNQGRTWELRDYSYYNA
jgi:hypothetical protein